MNIKTQRGFIGLGALIAIILGLVVVGGGAYYIGHQNVAPQTQGNYPDISTTQQQNTDSSVQATTNTKATTPTHTTTSASTGAFLTFASPQTGATVSATTPVQVKWRFDDPSIVQTFPNANTYVVLHLINSDGKDIGSVGDGYTINGTTASWNIASNLVQKFYTLTSGAKYKIRATLQYQPANYTCDPAMPYGPKDCAPLYSDADKALINKAKQYQSESGWFTVDLSGYNQPTATIDQNSLQASLASRGTASITGTANVSMVQMDI